MTQAADPSGQINMGLLSEVISGTLDAAIGTDVAVACSMEGGAEPEEIIVVLRELWEPRTRRKNKR